MKFVSYSIDGALSYGVLSDFEDFIWDLPSIQQKYESPKLPESLLEGIKMGESFMDAVKDALEFGQTQDDCSSFKISLEKVAFAAPIPRPGKNIMCVGKNYRDHAIELGSEADIPSHIMMFTKAPTTVIGHEGLIDCHSDVTSELDYEGELAVVIGKEGKNIRRDHALEHVFGYTIVNDITARDLQSRHKQFFIGKSLDTFCPMGPSITHASMIEDPGQLKITTTVNGEVRQQSDTSHFIFPIDEIISELSKGMTLEPGDIIATGTPAGVGKGFKPPRFLKSGDEIVIEIENIGILKNKVK
ncbi:fumarylacetoacetate hydrolase family protein [Falsibacillus albus]|uniref:FAA hydrolase family protein n=1 Tax=Falsibacillus albus TaxID=2478915 RepID=A0A3L7K2F2_9BACI|nr:fumarylacetoacetate hydrolase family protein [Falsibacillus albus]RLQ97238.1 FAA hydrolase family protein [Falsibacillus albus]